MRGERNFYNIENMKRDLLNTGHLLSDKAMDFALNILRRIKNCNEIFIAHSFIASYIEQEGGDSWNVVGRQFKDTQARQKGDGLYLFPVFFGETRKGHWLAVIIHISHDGIYGLVVDSCPGLYTAETQLLKIRLGRAVSDHRAIIWRTAACQIQKELECGPRTLWTIAIFCSGWICNRDMEEIENCLRNLGGLRHAVAALHIRKEVHDWFGGDDGWIRNNRVWDTDRGIRL